MCYCSLDISLEFFDFAYCSYCFLHPLIFLREHCDIFFGHTICKPGPLSDGVLKAPIYHMAPFNSTQQGTVWKKYRKSL